ncbi:MAG: c-type cytochrome [Sulfuricaulis sp.]|nr:c-type cytochrome [Sulfuricaulis sp.]
MRTSARYAGATCAALMFLLVGCEPSVNVPSAAPPEPSAVNATSPEQMRRGAQLYATNCAACHGAQAEGAPNWQKPGADGKYPAPPLNGTGHAWHHPLAVLKTTIKGGTMRLGGSMPAWGGKLDDADIEAVIAWFQSRWPDEIYQSWMAMDQKARQGTDNR